MQPIQDNRSDRGWPRDQPRVLLVGAGVVGRAIAACHVERGIAFGMADQDPAAIESAASWLRAGDVPVRESQSPLAGLHQIIAELDDRTETPPIVIESIIEDVDAKRQLFAGLQATIGGDATLCSNTSTLLVSEIAKGDIERPERVVGLHFFMPVLERFAAEVVSGERSDPSAVDVASEHAKRLGKRPVRCKDSPGFVVNRILSPYLNQALLLLCRGATDVQIERAALAYGMPFSPLELIDWIGIPTMFHAGRAYWRAFPKRIAPSPMVPAMLKRKRLGRAVGAGLYDYSDGRRSRTLSPQVLELVETYRIDARGFSDGEVLQLLAIPMWIEAQQLIDEGVADSMDTVDLAIAGGLGFSSDQRWSEFFSELGPTAVQDAIMRWGPEFASMSMESG